MSVNPAQVKPKLLVVDDQPKNLHAMSRLIEGEDIEVIEAQSGQEALIAVLQHDFFLILMDVQMPEMNGFEAAELILSNKKTAHMPIIFLTAINKTDEFVLQGYETGAVDYIYKPVDPHILDGKIRVFKELWKAKITLSEQKQELEAANNKIEVLLNAAGEGILSLDTEGKVVFANPSAIDLLEVDLDRLQQAKIQDFFVTSDDTALDPDLQFSSMLNTNTRNSTDQEQWQSHKGHSFYVEYSCNEILDKTQKSTGSVLMFQDVSTRKSLEDQLVQMAHYDSLTKLANRAMFHTSLEKAMQRQQRSGVLLAVLFIDLDNFKPVNDTHGHEAGDLLLQQVAERMSACVRKGDLTARLGGDEFAVLLHDLKEENNATIAAESILKELTRSFDLNGITVNISASVGISCYDGSDITPDELLKIADTAMYDAKNTGKGQVR